MPDTLNFGISRIAGEFVDDVSVKETLTVATRKNRVGITKKVYPHDPIVEVSIKGGGTPILALGVVADNGGVTGLAEGGVFIVKDREHTEGNEKFCEFSLGATHYPNAELGTVTEEEEEPAP